MRGFLAIMHGGQVLYSLRQLIARKTALSWPSRVFLNEFSFVSIELYLLSLKRFIFACFNYFWPVFCNEIYFRLWKLFNFQRFLYICSRKVFHVLKPDTTKITWEAQFSDLEAPLFVNPTRCLPFRLYQSLISSDDCVIGRRSSESFINFGLPRTVNEYIFHSNFHETETAERK